MGVFVVTHQPAKWLCWRHLYQSVPLSPAFSFWTFWSNLEWGKLHKTSQLWHHPPLLRGNLCYLPDFLILLTKREGLALLHIIKGKTKHKTHLVIQIKDIPYILFICTRHQLRLMEYLQWHPLQPKSVLKLSLYDPITQHDTFPQTSPPPGGTTWSSSLGFVRFQIFFMTARSSSLASSMFPSVLILSDVLTSANSVALNITVPSVLRGIFMATSRCGG